MTAQRAATPNARFRLWFAAGILALAFACLAAAPGPGVTWDEPTYVTAGYRYCRWLRGLSAQSFSRETIDEFWQVNHEHPPVAKLLYGAAGAPAGDDLLPALLSARICAALLFIALAGLVYLFVAASFGRIAGILAALALALMPRVFGHGHLAELDMPAALTCFAATAAFARAHTAKRWAIGAGLLWGLALLTKVNAVFLPLVLIPWALCAHRRRAVLPAAMLLVLGSATFFAGWPWLWHDTITRVKDYAVNKTERLGDAARPTGPINVPVYYLGKTYGAERAPWHYPLVMTLVTVPAGLLLFAGIGARRALAGVAQSIRGHSRAPTSGSPDSGERTPMTADAAGSGAVGALILASAALHLAVFVLPMTPKYDGVRLFLPAFPFIASLAGIGGARVWAWRRAAGRVLVAAVIALSAAALSYTHPYELSYYNEFVAGAWGAHRLGFETTYWGDTLTRGVMDAVNELCPDGSTLSVLPPYQQFLDALPWMKPELRWIKDWSAPAPPPDFLLVFPRQGMLDEFTADLLRTREPIRQWEYLGVPQCFLFALRPAR